MNMFYFFAGVLVGLVPFAHSKGWLTWAYDKAKPVVLGWLGVKTEEKPK